MKHRASGERGFKVIKRSLSDLFKKGQLQAASLGVSGTLSLLDQLVASATNFLTGVIVGRACTKGEFGLYLLCFNILLLVIDLQNSLLASPYTVMSQKAKGKALAEYTGSSLFQQLLLGLLVVATLMVSSNFLSSLNPSYSGLSPVMKALVLAMSFILLKEFIRKLCFAHLFMKGALWLDVSVAVIQLSILTALFLQGKISASWVFLIMGFACFLSVVGWLIMNKGLYTFSPRLFFSHFKRNWSFGSWLFGSSILWAASMTLYPWILAYYHGPEATGIWGACWGVVSLANPLMLGVQNFLGPRIVRSYASSGISGLTARVKRDSLLFLIIVLPFVAIFLTLGGRLTGLFYGEKYLGNGGVVQVLSINLLMMAACYPFSYGLLAMEKVRTYFLANIVPLLTTVSCGIFLVRIFGPLGVALGLMIGVSITATIIIICFLKSSRMAAING